MLTKLKPRDFPEGIDPARATVLLSLSAGLGGAYGETHLVSHDEALFALTRSSVVGGLEHVPLSTSIPPRLALGRWGDEELRITTASGEDHRLDIPRSERGDILDALEALYRAKGHHAELASLLERKRETEYDTKKKQQMLIELGDLYDRRLGQPEQAARCYGEVLEARPDAAQVVEALEAMFHRGAAFEKIGPLLTAHYQRRRQYEPLAALLERRVHHLKEPRERIATLIQLAELLGGKLGQPARALPFAGAALHEDVDNPEALVAFDGLAARADCWSQAAEVYFLAQAAAGTPALAAGLCRRRAHAHVRAGEHQPAIEAYVELLGKHADALDARDERAALDALETLYEHTGDHAARAKVLERLVEVLDDAGARVAAMHRLAIAFERDLGDLDRAWQLLETILEASPADLAAARGLERVHRAAERWPEVLAALDRLARLLPEPDVCADLVAEAARVAETQLHDLVTATDRWRKVLQLCAHGGETGGSRGDGDPGRVPRLEATTEEALGSLERLLAAQERWPELVEVLERHAEDARQPQLSARLLRRAAAIALEQLGDRERAVRELERALPYAPQDLATHEALWRLYDEAGAHQKLLATLDAVLGIVGDGEQKADRARVRRARLYGDDLGMTTEAIAAWQDVLRRRPNSLQALSGLVEQYQRAGKASEASALYDQKIALYQGQPDEQLRILMRQGALWEKHEAGAAEAAAAYERVLLMAPAHDAAFGRLEAMLEKRGDAEARMRLYLMRAETVGDPGAQLALYEKAATIAAERAKDPDAAYRKLAEVAHRAWRNERFMLAFGRTAVAAGRWRDIVDRLEQIRPAVDDRGVFDHNTDEIATQMVQANELDAERVPVALRLGQYCLMVRGDVEAALGHYRRAAQRDPTCDEAQHAIRGLLRDLGRHHDLAEHLRKMLALERYHGSTERSLLEELAGLLEGPLDSPDEAAEVRARARSGAGLLWLGLAALALAGAALAFVL